MSGIDSAFDGMIGQGFDFPKPEGEVLGRARLETPLETQVGGDHYKKYRIQPIEYCHANGIGVCESQVIQYVTRWRDKGGIQDLEEARHMIDLLIELEGKNG